MANTRPHQTPPTKADFEERGGPKTKVWVVLGSSSTCAEEDEGGPKGPTKGPSLSPPSILHPRQSPLQESCSSHLTLLPPTPPSGSLEIGACGPGRGRARARFRAGSLSLWDPGWSRAWWPPPPPLRWHLVLPVAPCHGHSREG